jgi:predicted DsbA family dithiol-disulfide isomerase
MACPYCRNGKNRLDRAYRCIQNANTIINRWKIVLRVLMIKPLLKAKHFSSVPFGTIT